MSNTLTNVKDIKVAQKALMPFMAQLLPVTAFSIDFSPLPADKLDTVRVPLVGAPSTSSDFAGDYTANADSTVTVAPVVLNRHKFKTVHVTARENAETALNTLETLVEAAAQQLAQDVLVDILSVVTAATYGAPGIPALAATSFDYKKVLGIREVCGNAKMPPNPRSLVLDSGYYTNLLADDVVAKSFNLNLNAPAVTEGMVKRLAGFNLLIGWANDHAGASAQNPAGYHLGMWIFSSLGFFGLLFAYLLHRSETGPNAHGLETITSRS